MKKIGIICEYNPFHNGHLYHINKIKEMFPDSVIILVLGGYFLERGDISLISKWNKTSIALSYGIDLVLELPTLYNTNSADIFASSAIEILSIFDIDYLIFGSESADLDKLTEIALMQEDEEIKNKIKGNLKRGLNYPTSLSKSLEISLKSNDTLAVSYIKAIKKIAPSIKPIAIKRTNDFNDVTSEDEIISAGNIRAKLKRGEGIDRFIPSYDRSLINTIDECKLFRMLRYKIITDDHLERYLGVDEGLENRLKNVVLKADSYDDLIEKIKTKRYTTARIKRLLIHILLGIEKNYIEEKITRPRVLGFNSEGRLLLKTVEGKYTTKANDDISSKIEKKAALIYEELTSDQSIELEFLNKPIKKES